MLIVAFVKVGVYAVSLFIIYEELVTLMELFLYPIRNKRVLNIFVLDIIMPFLLSAISNAMCDT
jgi:hypothetical protein